MDNKDTIVITIIWIILFLIILILLAFAYNNVANSINMNNSESINKNLSTSKNIIGAAIIIGLIGIVLIIISLVVGKGKWAVILEIFIFIALLIITILAFVAYCKLRNIPIATTARYLTLTTGIIGLLILIFFIIVIVIVADSVYKTISTISKTNKNIYTEGITNNDLLYENAIINNDILDQKFLESLNKYEQLTNQ